MSTTSITQRPIPKVAAVAVLVAGIAVGSLTLSRHDTVQTPGPTHPAAPLSQPAQHHTWHPTTAGGRVMIGS
jgi:hypothetical protein